MNSITSGGKNYFNSTVKDDRKNIMLQRRLLNAILVSLCYWTRKVLIQKCDTIFF